MCSIRVDITIRVVILFIYDYWAVSTAVVPRKKKGITVLGTIIY